jgi:hypothetical protein
MLMKSGVGAEHGVIVDSSVARQPTEACDDGVISDLTVMADMRTVHDIIIIADPRTSAALRGSDMDRDLLADLGSSTDFEPRRFAVECPILRLRTKAGMRKNPAVLPDDRAA